MHLMAAFNILEASISAADCFAIAHVMADAFIMGANSDILCPLDEQRFMEQHMPNASLVAIDSVYGHDGFIIEAVQITAHLNAWLAKQV